MVTNYIGADVDCRMTELAVERKGKIIARDRVPTDIKSLSNFLDSISGKKEMVVEEGPMAGWFIWHGVFCLNGLTDVANSSHILGKALRKC